MQKIEIVKCVFSKDKEKEVKLNYDKNFETRPVISGRDCSGKKEVTNFKIFSCSGSKECGKGLIDCVFNDFLHLVYFCLT